MLKNFVKSVFAATLAASLLIGCAEADEEEQKADENTPEAIHAKETKEFGELFVGKWQETNNKDAPFFVYEYYEGDIFKFYTEDNTSIKYIKFLNKEGDSFNTTWPSSLQWCKSCNDIYLSYTFTNKNQLWEKDLNSSSSNYNTTTGYTRITDTSSEGGDNTTPSVPSNWNIADGSYTYGVFTLKFNSDGTFTAKNNSMETATGTYTYSDGILNTTTTNRAKTDTYNDSFTVNVADNGNMTLTLKGESKKTSTTGSNFNTSDRSQALMVWCFGDTAASNTKSLTFSKK